MDSMPIPVRVTADEIKELKRRAKKNRKTLAQHVRDRLELPQATRGRPRRIDEAK